MNGTVYLMNSAMMPRSGYYACVTVPKRCFAKLFHDLVNAGWEWRSAIGYEQNASMLSSLLGVEVPLSMEQVFPSRGDVMLITKLAYRTRAKGEPVSEDDFIWLAAVYCGYSVDNLIDADQMLWDYEYEEDDGEIQ